MSNLTSNASPETSQPGIPTTVPSSAPAGAAELTSLKTRLRHALRQFPDFPTKGILFEDILPIFADASLHADLLDALEAHIVESHGHQNKPHVIIALESRGFLFGPSLALRLGASFVAVRKKGKLPGPTHTVSYQKEYGEDFFQIQKGAVEEGSRVIVVDDLLATGGSASAAGQLVKLLGGQLLEYIFLIELDFLKGREKLDGIPVFTLLESQGGDDGSS